MTNRSIYRKLLLPSLLIAFSGLHAQITETTDSLHVDKGKIVERLESGKDKSGLSRWLYKNLVKSPDSERDKDIQNRPLPFSEAEGKVIRNIEINTYDPFGYSIENPEVQPDKTVERVGNAIHPKTKKIVIKDYLLFDKGSRYDSVKIKESERLIRQQRFSRKVRIDYVPVGDSIDVIVYSLDSWSLFPSLVFSENKIGFKLSERNFMGWGHEFENYYGRDIETGKNAFQTRYTIPNIRRTYIGFDIGYSSNEKDELIKGVSLQRHFFSPLARWAGGAFHGERSYLDSISSKTGISAPLIKYGLTDFWGGYSFRLFDDQSPQARFTNLIVSGRYLNVDYRKKPDEAQDPDHFYADQNFYLVGLGISRRTFVQDKFIRNYNIIEDIPVGLMMGLTSGLQRKNHSDRLYLAGELKMGEYLNFGYLGFHIQYGGFLKSGRTEEAVFNLRLDYFSRMKSLGRWKIRNFISSDLIIGSHRADSRGDRLTLNENDPLGIKGFYSVNVIGTKKWLTHFQIHSYSPYHFLGFRVSPMFSSSFGLISGDNNKLIKGQFYSRIGFGVMLTNDFLVFSNLQFSFSWYNRIPGEGHNLFKTNTILVSDFSPMDFEFGKPELIEYSPYNPR